MPYFEIRQIMMGDPEVFTDLDFYSLSTLPFELRPTNTIHLDSSGNVIYDTPEFNAIADSFSGGVPMQRARLQFDLDETHRIER